MLGGGDSSEVFEMELAVFSFGCKSPCMVHRQIGSGAEAGMKSPGYKRIPEWRYCM